MGKFRASLKTLSTMKIARYVEQLMHRSNKYITKLFFTMSNKLEWFKHMAYVMQYPLTAALAGYY